MLGRYQATFVAVEGCSLLQDPANGRVTVYNGLARYICNLGFWLDGASKRQCTNGRWVPSSSPRCKNASLDRLLVNSVLSSQVAGCRMIAAMTLILMTTNRTKATTNRTRVTTIPEATRTRRVTVEAAISTPTVTPIAVTHHEDHNEADIPAPTATPTAVTHREDHAEAVAGAEDQVEATLTPDPHEDHAEAIAEVEAVAKVVAGAVAGAGDQEEAEDLAAVIVLAVETTVAVTAVGDPVAATAARLTGNATMDMGQIPVVDRPITGNDTAMVQVRVLALTEIQQFPMTCVVLKHFCWILNSPLRVNM